MFIVPVAIPWHSTRVFKVENYDGSCNYALYVMALVKHLLCAVIIKVSFLFLLLFYLFDFLASSTILTLYLIYEMNCPLQQQTVSVCIVHCFKVTPVDAISQTKVECSTRPFLCTMYIIQSTL
ncbi:hypothetical protein F4604DRAFT_1797433 [Suillus subluteus]|nr:hypothetical protein F4604DRAFT_1797433 [Suillus subluteus]